MDLAKRLAMHLARSTAMHWAMWRRLRWETPKDSVRQMAMYWVMPMVLRSVKRMAKLMQMR